jgi:hypothetical protein
LGGGFTHSFVHGVLRRRDIPPVIISRLAGIDQRAALGKRRRSCETLFKPPLDVFPVQSDGSVWMMRLGVSVLILPGDRDEEGHLHERSTKRKNHGSSKKQ